MARLGMQETAMKKRFGWTEDSSMIKRYTSLTDEDADNFYREALGLGTKKKDIAINPIARRCSKCGKLIETGEYCPQCAEIQKLTEANTKAQIEKDKMQVVVFDLVKHVLDLTDRLDAQEVREQIMSQVATDQTDEKIKEAVNNFDSIMKKAIEEEKKKSVIGTTEKSTTPMPQA